MSGAKHDRDKYTGHFVAANYVRDNAGRMVDGATPKEETL